MKKVLGLFIMLSAFLLAGCGVIDQGNVGVRTQFGDVDPKPVANGFYTSIISDVDIYTTKEVAVKLVDLTPKAKDNLKMEKLDLSVYYVATPAAIPGFQTKFSNMSVKGDNGVYLPGYSMVHDISQSASMDSVATFESLLIHQNRALLEASVKEKAQAMLDAAAPHTFTVTRVIVTTADTDKTIEQSIQNNIMADKDLETARKRVGIREQDALANEKLQQSLTPEFLQHEYNLAVAECAKRSSCTMIVDGSSSAKAVSVK
ncbi:lipoprotein [Erwinia phage vB_EamM-Bue1]|uniref:Band 7 domain-containing protein n=1 Tax=Erwinia phage vB_EamM-Bue1 TaxID=2099338 RepID=A0A2P1JUB8_9CAUD|nr:lipoprotein [Erwinia phage vB_EamM-Bue1]AVO22932.1 hypothetical protein [Erwinia phage vB_EamM-Bue1]